MEDVAATTGEGDQGGAGAAPAGDTNAAPATPTQDATQGDIGGQDLDAELSAKFDEVTAEPSKEAAGQPRTPDGKFTTTKEGEEAAKEVSGKPDESDQKPGEGDGDKEPDGTDKQPVSATPAPAHWSKESKEAFEALPPEQQKVLGAQALAERQTISRLGQYAQQIKPVVDVVGKYQQTFERHQMSPHEGIDAVMAVQQLLDQNPIAGIQHIAETYGVNLEEMVLDSQLGLGPDPQVAQLQQQVTALQAQLSQVNGNVQHQQQHQQQQELQANTQTMRTHIEAFAQDKPDFDELSDDILAEFKVLEQSGQKLTPDQMLEKAYETARWRNPTSREKLIKAQAAAEEKARTDAARAAADKAKTAGAINVGQNAPINGATPSDLDAALSQKFDAVMARHA